MSWVDADEALEARCQALERLGEAPDRVARLVEGLKDESWRVRKLAAERLLELQPDAELVTRLVELLGLKDEAGSRNAAAAVLSRLGPAALEPVLAQVEHPDEGRRKLAADILGRLGRGEAVPRLVRLLDDVDGNVRVAAAEALGHLGGSDAQQALEGLLASPEPLLRVCALEGLTEQRAPPALPVLGVLLDEPWTRPSAFRLLGLVDHPTAHALVCRAIAASSTRELALGSLAARGELLEPRLALAVGSVLKGSRDVVPWLSQALGSEAEERRVGALIAAHALGDPLLALPVARAVRPGREAELALAVLLRLGTRGAGLLVSAKTALSQLATPGRLVVDDAIVQLAEPSHVASLSVLLHSGEPSLAALATRALGHTRARAAIPLLAKGLGDEALASLSGCSLVTLAVSWPHEVREALAPLLGREPLSASLVRTWAEVVKGDAAELLERAASHPSDEVRAAAMESAPLAPVVAASLLAAAMGDASVVVRRAATRGLCCLGPVMAQPLLDRALADADPAVLSLAASAAAELPYREAVPRLAALAGHHEPGVVLAALTALGRLGELPDAVLLAAAARGEPELERYVFELGAERPAVVARAVARLAHPRRDLREAAARALAVAAGQAEQGALRAARALEADPAIGRWLDAALERLAHRRWSERSAAKPNSLGGDDAPGPGGR